jgi:hypothetical protein
MSEIIKQEPAAIKRLGKEIFVSQPVKKIPFKDCNVIYIDQDFKKELLSNGVKKVDKYIIENFAYTICDEKEKEFNLFADLQADSTDIALSGNLGSGRACYFGKKYNIKGIGRTSLARADPTSQHGNGRLDLITALREAIMSRYIWQNFSTKTSRTIAVISIPSFTKYSWSNKPLQNALLIREDNGNLDRISHAAYHSLNRKIDITSLSRKCGIFDADLFFHQVLHGAWSIGNITLSGNWLDMESTSFVKERGPYCNITEKYISNIFGWEGIGAIKALSEYSRLTGQKLNTQDFFKARRKRLIILFRSFLNVKISISQLSSWEHLSKIYIIKKPINVFKEKSSLGAWINFNTFFRKLYYFKNIKIEKIVNKIIQANRKELYLFKKDEKNHFTHVKVDKKKLEEQLKNFIKIFLSLNPRVIEKEVFQEKLNFLEITKKIKVTYSQYLKNKISTKKLCSLFSENNFIYLK